MMREKQRRYGKTKFSPKPNWLLETVNIRLLKDLFLVYSVLFNLYSGDNEWLAYKYTLCLQVYGGYVATFGFWHWCHELNKRIPFCRSISSPGKGVVSRHISSKFHLVHTLEIVFSGGSTDPEKPCTENDLSHSHWLSNDITGVGDFFLSNFQSSLILSYLPYLKFKW